MGCNRKKMSKYDGFFFLVYLTLLKGGGGVNERNIWFIILPLNLSLSFPHYIITLFKKKKEYSSNNFWKECSESEENNIFLENPPIHSIIISLSLQTTLLPTKWCWRGFSHLYWRRKRHFFPLNSFWYEVIITKSLRHLSYAYFLIVNLT